MINTYERIPELDGLLSKALERITGLEGTSPWANTVGTAESLPVVMVLEKNSHPIFVPSMIPSERFYTKKTILFGVCCDGRIK